MLPKVCTPHSFMLQGPTNGTSLNKSHDAALCKLGLGLPDIWDCQNEEYSRAARCMPYIEND